MKVIIIGAGIGGLTAALSMQQVGIKVKVFEAQPSICPLEFGINLLPHASRELSELGLKSAIDDIAIRISATHYYTTNGQLILSDPCGTFAGYRWPHWSMRRSTLQNLLLEEFTALAGDKALVYDAKLSNFVQTGNKVTAHFLNPATGKIDKEEADLLIGADGLHSSIRKKMFPREEKPRYSGKIAYRGITIAPQFLDGQSMAVIGDTAQQLICYPTSKQQLEKLNGKSLVDWIAFLSVDQSQLSTSDWNKEISPAQLENNLASWQFNWVDIPQLLHSTAKVYQFPLYDRDPHRQWTFGRVTLLGDAAHPMLPTNSNGAAQAILDARALAYALARCSDPMAGLEDYEMDRLEAANRVVKASRKEGFGRVLEIAANYSPKENEYLHDHLPLKEVQQVLMDFKNKAHIGVEQVNSQSSYSLDHQQ